MTHKNPYETIAEAYDYMLRHVDYERWYQYISGIMIYFVNNPRSVLELGCGTGRFGAKFSADDFIIYGIDRSMRMLQVAKTRAFRNFRIICSDIRQFAISRKVDFIFSVHDTMNYLLETDDVRKTLSCVRECMHEESVFMFDITTEHNIDRFFDNKTSFYKTGGKYISWSNRYDREKKHIISSFLVTLASGKQLREEHVQKIYTLAEMKQILNEEGFDIIAIGSDYTMDYPSPETVMINFITKKRSG